MASLRPEDYRIVWVAPLEIEAQAALHMLDHKHAGRFPIRRGDDHIFQAGSMCGHNVVIATLPAGQEYGTGSAAALASQAKKFFPNLWFGLLVGVAAGIPDLERSPPRDIRLGDVLVSIPDVEHSGTVAYDLGKDTGGNELELLRQSHILTQTEPVEHDKLYKVGDDGGDQLVERKPRLESQRTQVWYGPIGSGEKLMKNAAMRDQLRDKYGIIGLEMEAAGTMNRIPVGVIRGVCDYADKHKNKNWQPYAAAMAAAYAKAILFEINPGQGPTNSRPDLHGDSSNKRSSKRRTREPTESDEDGAGKRRRKSSGVATGRDRIILSG
ncbi:purine and uridine phosphorylase [Hypoxylon crocopeplum]|nr:purine and uridine phosphorylase [Hypoxylon crocopeplum]